MNIGIHQITQRRIDHAMARQRILSTKTSGDDAHAVMAATIASTSMAHVQMTVIDYLQYIGIESILQRHAHSLHAISHEYPVVDANRTWKFLIEMGGPGRCGQDQTSL